MVKNLDLELRLDDQGVFNTVTTGQHRQPEYAFVELVRNSVASGSTQLDIIVTPHEIRAVDDGKGMSEEDVRDRFLYVGRRSDDTNRDNVYGYGFKALLGYLKGQNTEINVSTKKEGFGGVRFVMSEDPSTRYGWGVKGQVSNEESTGTDIYVKGIQEQPDTNTIKNLLEDYCRYVPLNLKFNGETISKKPEILNKSSPESVKFSNGIRGEIGLGTEPNYIILLKQGIKIGYESIHGLSGIVDCDWINRTVGGDLREDDKYNQLKEIINSHIDDLALRVAKRKFTSDSENNFLRSYIVARKENLDDALRKVRVFGSYRGPVSIEDIENTRENKGRIYYSDTLNQLVEDIISAGDLVLVKEKGGWQELPAVLNNNAYKSFAVNVDKIEQDQVLIPFIAQTENQIKFLKAAKLLVPTVRFGKMESKHGAKLDFIPASNQGGDIYLNIDNPIVRNLIELEEQGVVPLAPYLGHELSHNKFKGHPPEQQMLEQHLTYQLLFNAMKLGLHIPEDVKNLTAVMNVLTRSNKDEELQEMIMLEPEN